MADGVEHGTPSSSIYGVLVTVTKLALPSAAHREAATGPSRKKSPLTLGTPSPSQPSSNIYRSLWSPNHGLYWTLTSLGGSSQDAHLFAVFTALAQNYQASV